MGDWMGETVGIAGSGTIATGLATCLARSGEHILWARSDASATRAAAAIAKACERAGDGRQSASIRVTTDLADLSGATLIVEAISENQPDKEALLSRLNRVAAAGAIIASTTSSLSIPALAAASGRPEAFAGIHVFNPVPKMKLVELSFSDEASTATRNRAAAFCEQIEKTAVEVPALQGFVVNRLLFPYLFDAVRLMERTGVPASAIDECIQMGCGHPMGPVALLDYIGLDVSVAIGDAIQIEVPASLRALVADGALGRKTGRGLYPADFYEAR